MKARALAVSTAALALLLPGWAPAATCPDRVPLGITSAAAGSVKCQAAIAKEGGKYAKKKLQGEAKCRQKEATGSCPDAKTAQKIAKAASDAAAKIAKACADDTVQAGLSNSYASLTDDADITSCMLSQHNATADVAVGNSTGLSTEDFPGESNKERGKCVKELSNSGAKYIDKARKIAAKCIDKQMKDGVGGDLVATCVGQYSSGVFTPPSDSKTAASQTNLITKTEAKIAKKCDDAPGYIPSIYACAGATSVADLQDCIICGGWDATLDLLEQAYSERGTLVSNDPNAIQTAVDAASPGDKLLIAAGDYTEEVIIVTNDLQLVGCGGATNDRPRFLPVGGGTGNGMFAAGVDGLHFQSLLFDTIENNGIFITGANGVSFRDVIAEGNLISTYGIFPVSSNNVLIETSTANEVDDAGLYVGQSTNITVRYSRAEGNVAGIEIENSGSAFVHNNYLNNNTGGLLVFRLPGPTLQISTDHLISHNVSENNNTPNFGSGTVGIIPDGSGIVVLSNDNGTFEYNVLRGNNTLGIALADQEIFNILSGDPNNLPFDPTSPDQTCLGNLVQRNSLSGNGLSPDTEGPNGLPPGIAGDLVYAIFEDPNGVGNCFQDNEDPNQIVETFLSPNTCP